MQETQRARISSALAVLASVAIAAPGAAASGYVGSAACEGCHTYIYESWRTTRHGASVMTGEQARAAGYPLPVARRGATAPTVAGWDDVSYVIGRRQRIAYVDRAGEVQDTAYHHRLASWRSFPSRNLRECGSCHFTGPREPSGGEHAPVDQSWVELDIGCEACHGPGGRHVESLEREDIVLDASSRLCGRCHTTVGKVLPADDRHDLHDLVQVWNRDRHATGTRFHSHNAFCARCHAPLAGAFAESQASTRQRVFTEHKDSVTCVGCHNPHATTNPHYAQAEITLEPARLPRLHVYRGDDGDFTTTDFDELESVEQVCLGCHRGADRVELHHAGATCSDCHNGYRRNRTRESRVLHDANRPGLSCRPCHRDADHLMAILYGDPEFLQPKYIHDLRTLPAAVRDRHGFRFTGRDYRPAGAPDVEDPSSAYARRSVDAQVTQDAAAAERPRTALADAAVAVPVPARIRRADAARDALLAREPHRRLGERAELRARQDALAAAPARAAGYLALALAYAQGGEAHAAREVLAAALALDEPQALVALGAAGVRSTARDAGIADGSGALVEILAGTGSGDADRSAMRGLLALHRGRAEEAARALVGARDHVPGASLHLALAELALGRHASALDHLDAVLEAEPDHVTARLARAWALIERRRFAPARRALEDVLAAEPGNAIAHLLLGRGHLGEGDPERAARALETAVAADPQLLDARFLLARSHRLAGDVRAAVHVYEAIVERAPDSFDARFTLASLLKLSSDSLAWVHQSRREQARPPGVGDPAWQRYLARLERSSRSYAQLAASEFGLALRLRPSDPRAVHQVGNIYRRTGRLPQALRYFRWLSTIEPDEWLHLYRLGAVAVELGRHDEAIRALRRARDLAPDQGDVHNALGLAYARAERFDEAVATLREGTIHAPFDPALHTNLGAACARAQDLDCALAASRRSLELASFPIPRTHLTYTNLALVHLAQGDEGHAANALKNALHVYPGYAPARRLLARVETGDPPPALDGADADGIVFNDLLERFGEVTTVVLDHE